jgi:putative methionine-R-sulfoxide reductase with GAF domain
MTDKKARAQSPSDRPPEDLKKERDAFIQQFFRKGAQFTEELLKENERLRDRIAELEGDNQKLRTHLASDGAIRDLLRKIEELELEKRELINRSVRFEAVSGDLSSRYEEIESELANLANLYVATSQLHSAHSVRNVVRNIKELLAQLLGASAFVVYLVSDDGKELVSIASEGVNAAEVARAPVGVGTIGKAFSSGRLHFVDRGDVSKGTIGDPAAVIPLGIDGKIIGVIAIIATLPQKTEFVNVDSELFRLLGAQAAPALVNARLFTDTGRRIPGHQAFLDLED